MLEPGLASGSRTQPVWVSEPPARQLRGTFAHGDAPPPLWRLVDPARLAVSIAGRTRQVDHAAFALLWRLLLRSPRIVRREELEAVLLESGHDTRLLAQYISRARKAIDDHSRELRLIRTVYGYGYQFIGMIDRTPNGPGFSTRPPPTAV